MVKGNTYSGKELYQYLVESIKPTWGQEADALSKYLLKEVFNYGLADIVSNVPVNLDGNTVNELDLIIHRLKNQEPIQYILGYSYFLERKFTVTRDVLIPRPETEDLVLLILSKNNIDNPRILDIGVGSGCIGITLALETGVNTFTGLDFSQSILNVAQVNALQLGAKMKGLKVDILKEDIPDSGFDIMVSNPPYVLPSEKIYMKKNVIEFEPARALYVPENDPLIFYLHIAKQASRILNRKGTLFLEINEMYGVDVKRVLLNFNFSEVEIVKDIHGKDRFVLGKAKS